MDFGIDSIQFHRGKWKHGKRKARLPLEVFVVTSRTRCLNMEELNIDTFDHHREDPDKLRKHDANDKSGLSSNENEHKNVFCLSKSSVKPDNRK